MRFRRGRVNVGARLDYVKKINDRMGAPGARVGRWAQFTWWYAALRDTRTPGAENKEPSLRALPSSKEDALIPWVFREWAKDDRRTTTAQAAVQYRNIRDWWLAARPDINTFSWGEAIAAAADWHAQLRASSATVLAARGTLVKRYKDGWAWYMLHGDPDLLTNDGGITDDQYDAFRAVGDSLGHCYQRESYTSRYLRGYENYTLYTAAGVPMCTLAMHPGQFEVEEARRSQNELIEYTHAAAPYVRDLLKNAPYSDWGEATSATGWENTDEAWDIHVGDSRSCEVRDGEFSVDLSEAKPVLVVTTWVVGNQSTADRATEIALCYGLSDRLDRYEEATSNDRWDLVHEAYEDPRINRHRHKACDEVEMDEVERGEKLTLTRRILLPTDPKHLPFDCREAAKEVAWDLASAGAWFWDEYPYNLQSAIERLLDKAEASYPDGEDGQASRRLRGRRQRRV